MTLKFHCDLTKTKWKRTAASRFEQWRIIVLIWHKSLCVNTCFIMDTILEADSCRVYICGGMTGKVTHSSEQYSFLFLKIVSIIDVRLETVEIGLRPCSWLLVKRDFVHIFWQWLKKCVPWHSLWIFSYWVLKFPIVCEFNVLSTRMLEVW